MKHLLSAILFAGASFSPVVVFCQAKDPFRNIPVICYHQVRDWKPADSKFSRIYIVPVNTFAAQIKALKDNDFHPILPDQVLGKRMVPSKPLIITFDDGTEGQYTDAKPVLEKYGFKAVYFIMTVTLGKPGYLSAAQIRELSGKGNTIGCHTWNHKRVTSYTTTDWNEQLVKPMETLKSITGKIPRYFAYPYGLWNRNAIEQLKKYNYIAAFRLSGSSDALEPSYTVKRIIVDGNWNAAQLIKALNSYKN
ncbi:MAG: hypothetical protein BGO70_14410 [Bacteroidetes bacterium 43-93]|nr:polysaccharide deacetylase family protein [Bacteroidota bacterium]OJW96989.1 MAG: hypothetical protein BGO70_14410 [Bacteroidetes bacterium 43-93]